MADQVCFHCDSPATKLCDHVFAWGVGGYQRAGWPNQWVALASGDKSYTCDRPLCDDCATIAGTIRRCPFAQSIDLCKDHDQWISPNVEPMLEHEAEEFRRRLHFKAKLELAHKSHEC